MNDLPKIGLGCAGLSGLYGARSQDDAIKTLNRAIDIGCIIWDTANVYGNGDNERLLGKVLRDRRDGVFLCSKFGFEPSSQPGLGKMTVDCSPAAVRRHFDGSLSRLGVSDIDLFYAHRIDPKVPIEETVAAMAELVREGKVQYLGLSEPSPTSIRRAHAVHPITAVQIEYSPWFLDHEDNGVIETCKELGIMVVGYSPLGRGFLTGAIRSVEDFEAGDFRRNLPRFAPDVFGKNLELVDALKALAAEKGCTVAQFTLAWIVRQGVLPIPGSSKIERLEENFGALKISVTAEDDRRVRDIVKQFPAVGARYSEHLMSLVNI